MLGPVVGPLDERYSQVPIAVKFRKSISSLIKISTQKTHNLLTFPQNLECDFSSYNIFDFNGMIACPAKAG
jgi:hypothetical protein